MVSDDELEKVRVTFLRYATVTEIKAHAQTQNANHINRTPALFSLES